VQELWRKLVLGISPMAIYRHVADRDELIGLVMERALADCIPSPQPDSPWQQQLIAYFEAFWTVMTNEPGLGAIAITRPL
jgi:TetR/AcrR family tetracycline transcriptional repressor